MPRNMPRNMKGMATWVKVLLIVCGLGLLGIIALCFGVYSLVSQGTNPAAIQKVADSIVTFDGPLPDKFSFTMGFSIMGTNVVAINDTQDKALYNLFSVTAKSKTASNPQEVIDQITKGGSLPTAPGASSPSAKKFTVEDKGTMDVGGVQMPYAIGKSETTSGSVDQFFGVVQPAGNPGMVFLMVQGTATDNDGGKVTVDKVKEFTNHIKAFK